MEVHLVLLGYSSCLVLRNDSLVLEIDLVADDDHGRVLVLHLVDARHPVGYRRERLLICHVEAQDYSVRLTVKLICYVPNLFLTCRVPYFDLDFAIIFFIVVFSENIVNCDSLEVR